MKKRGPSIIEIAITLTVIALAVGAFLFGASVMRGSGIKKIPVEIAQYRSAVLNFRNMHAALPGDFAGATALWGAASDDPALCKSTAGTGTNTCNGDMSGLVGVNFTDANDLNETFRAWQHLANAGLIEGSYTGLSASGRGNDIMARPGIDVPASRVEGAGFLLYYNLTTDGQMRYFPTANHVIRFAALSPESGWGAPIISAADAAIIDSKLDDGLPATGAVRSARHNRLPECVTTDDMATARYAVDSNTKGCFLETLVE